MMAEEMAAGREMDALIARQVFGHEVRGAVIWEDLNSPNLRHAPHYSTDMSSAMQVMNWLRRRYWTVHIEATDIKTPTYCVTLHDLTKPSIIYSGENLPMLICQCALAVLPEQD